MALILSGKELIDYSLNKPVFPAGANRDDEERLRFKYPQVAAEVLSAELTKVTEGVVGKHDLMMRIFALLDSEDGIDAIQATNFSKILVSFLRTKNVSPLPFQSVKRNQTVSDMFPFSCKLCQDNPIPYDNKTNFDSEKLITTVVFYSCSIALYASVAGNP